MRVSTTPPLIGIQIDHAASASLHRQVYEALRGAILRRHLDPGMRLPATRAMARQLGVSRNTVVAAYEQLLVEGYIEAKVGSGTCVTRSLDRETLSAGRHLSNDVEGQKTSISRRGRALSKDSVVTLRWPNSPRAFEAGLPDPAIFPFRLWARLTARRWRSPGYSLTTYGDPSGYAPLREAIAHYLKLWRGVKCDKEEIIIVSGSQSAIDLCARLLADPEDCALIENPGYRGARAAFVAAGLKLLPLPVDEDGANILKCNSAPRNVRVAYVTPSHQYPLGVTMTVQRRLALLNWAQRRRAWILEDDYDSEYRFRGNPLPSLQGLDSGGCVIYIGTFSKTLFPSLRLGFLVAPPALVDNFRRAQGALCCHAPLLQQVVLADFIAEGHFARHLARSRHIYGERRSLLVECLKRELDGLLQVRGTNAGLHIAALLAKHEDDEQCSQDVASRGVFTLPLSYCDLNRSSQHPGLLLGYAALTPNQIREGVTRLAITLGRKLRRKESGKGAR